MEFVLNKNDGRKPSWSGLLRPPKGSAIMESIDSPSIIVSNRQYHETSGLQQDSVQSTLPSMPDITLTSEFTSLKLGSVEPNDNAPKSFLLIDGRELLQVSSTEEFITKLGIGDGVRVKVVSIFGNTGDGKSHTMNQAFFEGENVFPTSDQQDSCTLGVWAAFDPNLEVICLDTEGLLGSTNREKQRTRLLLKVLGVSDVIVYRTRTERLHRDMFTFLGWSSKAYTHHFQAALATKAQLHILGPAVVVFHETRHTRPLVSCGVESPEDLLRSRFKELGLSTDAFSSLRYVGAQTLEPPTSFSVLKRALAAELANSGVRSPRHPAHVYTTLKLLNDKFSGEIQEGSSLFPDEYFTCPSICLSCSARCQHSMGHLNLCQSHFSPSKCRYQAQYENIVYVCKTCHRNGQEVVVNPKYGTNNEGSWLGLAMYAWSGYVIECPNCGEIYRSRQYWYGNSPPDVAAVRTEITHIWPGMSCGGSGTCGNSGQRLVDGVSLIKEAVASVSAEPTRVLGSWVADQLAPKYWRPNHLIKICSVCGIVFTPNMTKHHCRACGEGVCEKCSANNRPVPERGWHYPVRVCDNCSRREEENDGQVSSTSSQEENEVTARKVSEAVVTTLSSVASILEYPKSVILESARPGYWVRDSEARECCCCGTSFGPTLKLHHCRDCGQGVCCGCSPARIPVPHRGWPNPVRVCNKCHNKK